MSTKTKVIHNTPGSKPSTPFNQAKRDKLKELIITKIIKKLNIQLDNESLVRREVSAFITKDTLTEKDLIGLENKIKKMITDQYTKTKQIVEAIEDQIPKKQETKSVINESRQSFYQTENDKILSKTGINYNDITNFELRKLLRDEKTPLKRVELSEDEWTAIEKHKNNVHQQQLKLNREQERQTKQKVRQTYFNQMEDHKLKKELDKAISNEHHLKVLNNVDNLKKREVEETQIMKEKKEKEKVARDNQIVDNISRKVNQFVENRQFDKNLISKIKLKEHETKENEVKKKIEQKENLKKTLEFCDELKQRQKDENEKERQHDIKLMEEYTRVLDKQEQDRADYFKSIENRQKKHMSNMVENVLKKQDQELQDEERKIRKYVDEKNRKDDEEDSRRRKYIKDTKQHLKEFYNDQWDDKKLRAEIDKKIDDQQLDMWKDDNQHYFKKEKEISEQSKRNTQLYAEFLKSQMTNKSKSQRMTDEEYRLNRNIIEELAFSPGKSSSKFLI